MSHAFFLAENAKETCLDVFWAAAIYYDPSSIIPRYRVYLAAATPLDSLRPLGPPHLSTSNTVHIFCPRAIFDTLSYADLPMIFVRTTRQFYYKQLYISS